MCSIGTRGESWGPEERKLWLDEQSIKRSYYEEVLTKLEPLKEWFDIEQYGALSYDTEKYKLFVVTSRNWDASKPTILVTGGVHGYETSGVQGAVRFLETRARSYSDRFNIIVAPCISPWGYETINRWTPLAVDPNRSFTDRSSEESAAIAKYLTNRKEANAAFSLLAHFDLHETTDTDDTVFGPTKAARDGSAIEFECVGIPDGFYLVGNTPNPVPEFQKAIIEEVKKVTHIAPADASGCIIGETLEQFGVINYAGRELGLCMGMTEAQYVTTTEVYPDSPSATDEICTVAQVAVVTGGLDYLIATAL